MPLPTCSQPSSRPAFAPPRRSVPYAKRLKLAATSNPPRLQSPRLQDLVLQPLLLLVDERANAGDVILHGSELRGREVRAFRVAQCTRYGAQLGIRFFQNTTQPCQRAPCFLRCFIHMSPPAGVFCNVCRRSMSASVIAMSYRAERKLDHAHGGA